MSECRALANFVGNAVAAAVVARGERQLNAALLRRALEGREHV